MKHTPVYALLFIVLSLTISCSSLKKNKTFTKSSTDSTAHTQKESTQIKHHSEAKETVTSNSDSSATVISFEPDTANTVIYNKETGTIQIKGKIKEVKHSSKKEAVIKDSLVSHTSDTIKNKENSKVAVKKDNSVKAKQVERKAVAWWVYALGGLALVYLLLWLYKKWMQRFTIIP